MRIFLLLCIGALFIHCKSVDIDKNPPFEVSQSTYNYWVGGQPGVSGIRIIVNYTTDKQITFDKIYFQKKEGTVENYDKDGKTYLVGRINTSKPRGTDLTLDIDSKKEIQNKLPEEKKFPFELKENEAIIAYTYKGKTYHFKVKDIKKTKSDYYP